MPLVSSRRFVPPEGERLGNSQDLSEIEVKDVDFIVLERNVCSLQKGARALLVDELARYEELMRKYPLIFQSDGTDASYVSNEVSPSSAARRVWVSRILSSPTAAARGQGTSPPDAISYRI